MGRMILRCVALACALLVGSCRTPTQITVTLRTNLPCASPKPHTIMRIGAFEPALGKKPPVVDATVCVDGRIGSIVVVPSGGKSDELALQVTTRLGGEDPTSCDENGDFKGCIVARRALRFVPHSELDLPIDLDDVCAGVKCDPTKTCAGGNCVDARVKDSNACHGDGCRFVGGASPAKEWAYSYGAVTSDAGAVAQAADGSVYWAFGFRRTITLDVDQTALGGDDVALVKYSAAGEVVWSKHVGGDLDEIPYYLAVDPIDGSVVMLGNSHSATLDVSGSPLPIVGGGGLFLARFEPSGAVRWARRYDGAPIYGMVGVGAGGALFVAAQIEASVKWDGNPRGGSSADVVVATFPGGGGLATKVQVFDEAGGTEHLGDLAMTADGPVIVGTMSGTSTVHKMTPSFGQDGFVLALDGALVPRWEWSTVNASTSPEETEYISGVTVDASGNVVVAGAKGNTTIQFAGQDVSGSGVMYATLSPAGALVRSRVFPTNYRIGASLGLASNGPGGSIALYALLDGAPGAAAPFTFDPSLPVIDPAGGGDAFVVQLSQLGVPLRQRRFGDAGLQHASSLVIDRDGNLSLTGIFEGSFDFGFATLSPPVSPPEKAAWIAHLRP